MGKKQNVRQRCALLCQWKNRVLRIMEAGQARRIRRALQGKYQCDDGALRFQPSLKN